MTKNELKLKELEELLDSEEVMNLPLMEHFDLVLNVLPELSWVVKREKEYRERTGKELYEV